MGRKPNLSQETITRIETLHKAGFGPKAIVKQTGVSQRSVERWVRLARAAPPLTKLTQKKPPGRPRKVSRNTLSVINRQIKGQPRLSARQIKESNPELLENVSERTVSHYICKVLHLPSRRAAKKPLLTPRHKELRVAFAKKYSALPLENIRSIRIPTIFDRGTRQSTNPVANEPETDRRSAVTVSAVKDVNKHGRKKKVGGAFEKRERARVIQAMSECQDGQDPPETDKTNEPQDGAGDSLSAADSKTSQDSEADVGAGVAENPKDPEDFVKKRHSCSDSAEFHGVSSERKLVKSEGSVDEYIISKDWEFDWIKQEPNILNDRCDDEDVFHVNVKEEPFGDPTELVKQEHDI